MSISYLLQDKTVRFWDIRINESTNTVLPVTYYDSLGSPVTSVCVDPTGRLLVTGHEDSSCVLYDIRKNRQIQCFQPHTADIRLVQLADLKCILKALRIPCLLLVLLLEFINFFFFYLTDLYVSHHRLIIC